jgi:poly(hydroxyalkanoate) depolymerase family esterase
MRLKALRALAKAPPFRSLNGLQTATAGACVSSRLAVARVTGANPGALEMFIYIPPALPAHAPLVVILHGCGQTAAGYDGGTGWSILAEQLGFAVLAPQQAVANNPNTCFNWFEPGDAARDHGEAASIRAMIEQLVHNHDLDPARIFITGLSAGGAMTAAMLAAYPEIFAGGAIIAGLAAGSASTIPDAFRTMRHAPVRTAHQWGDLVREASPTRGPGHQWPIVSIWQGDADTVVSPGNGEALAMQWTNVHGIAPASAHMTQGRNFRRRAWSGSDAKVAVELIEVAGMGHGVPVGGASVDAYGRLGPYFLDVALSSTAAIARFWGFEVPVMAPSKDRRDDKPKPSFRGVHLKAEMDGRGGVRAVIEQSLKAAGLMKH